MSDLPQIDSIASIREEIQARRHAGESIALVPTMGALHEGHLSLIRIAALNADCVVVSIFLNPAQFGENEDLDRYPATLDQDCMLAGQAGANLVFCPTAESMYQANHSVWIDENALSCHLCGPLRPGHFRGVLTVVAKLFNIIRPDTAVFGRKDFQQLVLIRQLVRDLDYGIHILEGDIVREPDGLAMSSRNRYLSAPERKRAASLYGSLCAARESCSDGMVLAEELQELVLRHLDIQATDSVEYISIVDLNDLQPVDTVRDDCLLAISVRIGATRLIDNIPLNP